jgi:magnesium transporter
MPELDWTYGYPLALMLMLTVSTGLYLVLRRANWL